MSLTNTQIRQFSEKYRVGDKVIGNVTSIHDFGIFVGLEGDIDGLVHSSEISWIKTRVNPFEFANVGDVVEAMVLKVEPECLRIALSIKQCLMGNPYVEFDEKHIVGDKVIGNITSIHDFGIFIGLGDNIEGLVPKSHMALPPKTLPIQLVELGDAVEAIILRVVPEKSNIVLTMRQRLQKPLLEFAEKHALGDKVIGNIKAIMDYGFFVGLEGGIYGLVHISEISWEVEGKTALCNYKEGEEVSAVILSLDSEKGRIGLGIKQLEHDPS